MNWLAVIKAVAPKAKPGIAQGLANAMPGMVAEFALNTTLRQAHFLAQLAHESAGFKTATEYANGEAYEGRADLGNIEAGDGKRYKGRGLIQLTGRSNYAAASKALGVDLVSNPEMAAQFPHAVRSAGWYWSTRKLNVLADKDDARAVTKKINGGYNGLDDRMLYLARAKEALAKAEDGDLAEVKGKTMATSKTGGASIIAGGLATVATGKEVVNAAKEAHAAAADAGGLLMSVGPWVVVSLVIIGLCAFIWWDRREKLRTFGI